MLFTIITLELLVAVAVCFGNSPVARSRGILLEWFNDNGSVFQNYFSKIKCEFNHKTSYNQNDITERYIRFD